MVNRILVTGALGQIGTELVGALRSRHGEDAVIATDLRSSDGITMLDVMDLEEMDRIVSQGGVSVIYHLAALLSATGEKKPELCWRINVGGLENVLTVAKKQGCSVFAPSSIAVFGPDCPPIAPQITPLNPTTVYGRTKGEGEQMAIRSGIDVRGVRYPGLISYLAPAGGGTTDYAVDIFYQAIRYRHYTCFLAADCRLDMMYMPDAVSAAIGIMEADSTRFSHRNAFNVTAMQLAPEALAAEIRKHLPDFTLDYDIDPVRQSIAESWPDHIDDTAAREEWGWDPAFDVAATTRDMLAHLGDE